MADRYYGGEVCAFMNCRNARAKSRNLSFFRFPKEPERCLQWIVNSRRTDLSDNRSELNKRGYVLCSNHFEPSQFMNQAERKRLIWNAVPTLFDVCNQPSFSQTYGEMEQQASTSDETPSPNINQPGDSMIKICSMHFVDGQPTKKNQIPRLLLCYKAKVTGGHQTLVKKNLDLGIPKRKRQKLCRESPKTPYSSRESHTLQDVADSIRSLSNTSTERLRGPQRKYSGKHCATCCCSEKVTSMLMPTDTLCMMTSKQQVSDPVRVDACCQTYAVQCRCPSIKIEEGQELLTNITTANNCISNKLEWWKGNSKNKRATDMDLIPREVKLEMVVPNDEQPECILPDF